MARSYNILSRYCTAIVNYSGLVDNFTRYHFMVPLRKADGAFLLFHHHYRSLYSYAGKMSLLPFFFSRSAFKLLPLLCGISALLLFPAASLVLFNCRARFPELRRVAGAAGGLTENHHAWIL